jgi:hypothetical protein
MLLARGRLSLSLDFVQTIAAHQQSTKKAPKFRTVWTAIIKIQSDLDTATSQQNRPQLCDKGVEDLHPEHYLLGSPSRHAIVSRSLHQMNRVNEFNLIIVEYHCMSS